MAEMIRVAIKQAREPRWLEHAKRKRRKAHRTAVLWLASRSARPWFERLDLSQRRVLRRIEWPKMARRLLERDRKNLTESQVELLETGIVALAEGL